MKIPGLYRGKYIIAVYQGEALYFVGDNTKEVAAVMGITRADVRKKIYKGIYQIIDVTEIHDDCFKQEDIEFLFDFLNIKEVEI